MTSGGESDVQAELLARAEDLGWRFVGREELNAVRADQLSDVVVVPYLVAAIRKLNPGIEDERVEATVERVRSAVEPRDVMRWLRHGINVPLAGSTTTDVRLLDLADLENNEYFVTEEMVIATGGAREPRLDVVFLVNGLPLGIVENKAPTVPVVKAAQDFARYWDDAPQLVALGMVAGICNGVRFRVGPTGQAGLSGYTEWKDTHPYPRPPGAGELEMVLLGVFAPHTLADLAANYAVFETRDGVTRRKLARYQQFRAASKIVRRVLDGVHLRGLIWHTQGSGKSLTMVFAARKLLAAGLQSPTVLIVVDRTDLDDQINDTLTACSFDGVLSASRTRELQEALANDVRGVVVTTVHKFREAEAHLNARENVIVLVDEAHRTQEGDLGIFMRAALPNAKLFAFTGTPIETTDHSTRRHFSPEIDGRFEDYLDAYRIKEAIDDGATVPIVYESRMPRWAVSLDDVDETFETEFAGLTDEQKTELRARATRLKVVAKTPDRLSAITADIASYLRERTAPNGFKAQLVAVDREACALMAELLANDLHSDEYAVVMSAGKNDSDLIRRWSASAQLERLGLPVDDATEDDAADEEAAETSAGESDADDIGLGVTEKKAVKQLIKHFTSPTNPLKLLIVNNMLLTGFDAPVEQVMFLDRGLAGHNLLQAIARTNRPMPEQDKQYGVIVDYWGVFAQLEKALATYSSVDVELAAIKVDELRERFPVAVAEVLAVVAGYPWTASESKQGAWLLTRMQDEERARTFEDRGRVARGIYDTLAPDPGLRDHLGEYRRLAEVHARLRAVRYDDVFDPSEYMAKTAAIIHEVVDVAALQDSHVTVKIDGTLLDQLGGDGELTAEEKAAQIEAAVVHEIRARPHDPVLQQLSERLEALRTGKAKADEQAEKLLAEYEQLLLDLDKHHAGPAKLGLSAAAYGLYVLAQTRLPGESHDALLASVRRIDGRLPEVAGFDGWETRDDVRRAVGKLVIAELARDQATLQLVVDGFAVDGVQALVDYAAQGR